MSRSCHNSSHQPMALSLGMLWPSHSRWKVGGWWYIQPLVWAGRALGREAEFVTWQERGVLPLTPTVLERHTTITLPTGSFAAQLESAATFWKDIDLRMRKHTADFLGVCSLRDCNQNLLISVVQPWRYIYTSLLCVKYWRLNLESPSAHSSGVNIFLMNSIYLTLDICNTEVYIWGQSLFIVSGKKYSQEMIHLTYFRYLREDKINLALEVSIYSSLSVENFTHCKCLKLNAVNPLLHAKTNYPEKSHATLCLCFQPTLQAYSHCESQKLYIDILNFYSCMRPGAHLSSRFELWIWLSMSETFSKAGRWSSSSAAGIALKLGLVCTCNIRIYVLPLHRPWGHTHEVVSHLNSQLHVTLASHAACATLLCRVLGFCIPCLTPQGPEQILS